MHFKHIWGRSVASVASCTSCSFYNGATHGFGQAFYLLHRHESHLSAWYESWLETEYRLVWKWASILLIWVKRQRLDTKSSWKSLVWPLRMTLTPSETSLSMTWLAGPAWSTGTYLAILSSGQEYTRESSCLRGNSLMPTTTSRAAMWEVIL